MKKVLAALAILIAGLFSVPADAQTVRVRVVAVCGAETLPLSPNFLQMDVNGKLCVNATVSATITFPTFGAAFPATGDAIGFSQGGNLVAATGTAGNLNVNCQVGCAGGSFNNNADAVATSATNGQTAAWLYGWNGATFDRLQVDASKFLKVNIAAGLNANVTPADGATAPASAPVDSFNQVWNGATWDRMPGTTAGVKVNTAQVNGVTTLTGTGATGTGAQRVTVSTDQATNAGAALVKGGVGVVNGGSTYQAVAASQTATVLQTSTGATGDYLSHCVIYPTSTSPGVVTVFDNTNAAAGSAILFPGGATSLSNLAPISVPVGAVSTAGAWKVTTGASVSVVCYGKFS